MNIEEQSNYLAQAIINAIMEYGEGNLTIDVCNRLATRINNSILKATKCKVWREDKSIPLPKYACDGDACCDLVPYKVEKEQFRFIIHTGLHFALPEGYEMEIRPRSSFTKQWKVTILNSPSTIDYGYRGEVTLVFTPLLNNIDCRYFDIDRELEPFKLRKACAQLLIRRVEKIEWEEVENLKDLGTTERGEGGYGHSTEDNTNPPVEK